MAKKLTKREKNKIDKLAVKHWKVTLVLLLILSSLFVVAYFMGWLDKFLKKEPILSTAGGYSTTVDTLNDLKVNFLDVGQGDCIIIELPDGKNMIIDSGENKEVVKDEIEDFTTKNKIDTFDYVILTHQDSDHAGNMGWVIDNYTCNFIFRPNNYSSHKDSSSLPDDFNTKTDGGYESSTKIYSKFMVSAYNEKCTVEIFNKDSDFSNEIIYGGNSYKYNFDFLTPTADRNKISYSDPNDYSPIMTLEYGGKKIMFTGDAEKKNIEEYIEAYGDEINIDVLKVGHHGSRTSTTDEFLQMIDPEYAVIQCGIDNSYGHPHKEALSSILSYEEGVKTYRNDTNGMITISLSVAGQLAFDMERGDCSNNDVDGNGVDVDGEIEITQNVIIKINLKRFEIFDDTKRKLIV